MIENGRVFGIEFLGTLTILAFPIVSLLQCGCAKTQNGELQTLTAPVLQRSCSASLCHETSPLAQYPPTSGLHTKHLNSPGMDPTPAVCNNCHWNYEDRPGHRNDFIDGYDATTALRGGDNIVFFGGRFGSGGISVTALFDRAGAICRNISCHGGSAASLKWYGSGSAGCNACHGTGSAFDPLVVNGEGAEGRHIAHVENAGLSCDTCHSAYTERATHLNGQRDTADPLVNMVFFAPPNDSGSWVNDTGAATGNCVSLVCHGGSAEPEWYGPGSGSSVCLVCHAPGSPYDPLPMGSHSRHVSYAGYDCEECHYDYRNNSSHRNAVLDSVATAPQMLSFDSTLNPAGDYTTGPLTCIDLVCHGNALDAVNSQGDDITPEWGNATTGDCGSCHKAGADNLTQGSHAKHISTAGYSYSCDVCHGDGTSGHHAAGAFPVNGTVDVVFDSLLNPDGEYTAGNCGVLYCHGDLFAQSDGSDTTPDWGNSSTGACGSCHDTDDTDTTPGSWKSTGSHTTHFDNAGRGPGIAGCDDCHQTLSTATHVNGIVDFQGGGDLAATSTCDSCHSPDGVYDGVNDTTIGAKTNWTNGVYNGNSLVTGKEKWCAGCHDDGSSMVGGISAPNVIGDESGSSRYGATGYGFYKTGHGLSTASKYPWTGSAGRSGAGLNCEICHDATQDHCDAKARSFDCESDACDSNEYRTGYRLKLVNGNNPLTLPRQTPDCSTSGVQATDFRLCLQSGCHDATPFTNGSSTATNFGSGTRGVDFTNAHYLHLSIKRICGPGPTFRPDWRAGSAPCVTSCVHCHDVHGTIQLSMIRAVLPLVYNNSSVSFVCGGPSPYDPTPQDVLLGESDGTVWNANTIASGLCAIACHGSCGWNAIYYRSPLP